MRFFSSDAKNGAGQGLLERVIHAGRRFSSRKGAHSACIDGVRVRRHRTRYSGCRIIRTGTRREYGDVQLSGRARSGSVQRRFCRVAWLLHAMARRGGILACGAPCAAARRAQRSAEWRPAHCQQDCGGQAPQCPALLMGAIRLHPVHVSTLLRLRGGVNLCKPMRSQQFRVGRGT